MDVAVLEYSFKIIILQQLTIVSRPFQHGESSRVCCLMFLAFLPDPISIF